MKIFKDLSTYKNQTSLISKDEKISYQDLNVLAIKFTKSIKKRSLAAIICSNSLASIAAYIGLINSDCVVMLIDENISQLAIEKILKDYKPEYLSVPKQNKLKFNNYTEVDKLNNFFLLKRKKFFKFNLNDELMLLMPTSGTTGSSKFVRQSYSNVYSNALSISKYLNIKSNDACITTLPMSYVYGLSLINTHLFNGSQIVLNNNSVLEKDFWKKIPKYKITNFAGVPYTFEMLDRLDLKKFDLKSIKYLTQAGGKLNLVTKTRMFKYFSKIKVKLFIMYGAAEATARMTYLPWKYFNKKIESVGKPIPGGQIWIEDSKKRKIKKPFEVGEIIYKGKNVCLGYSKNFKDLIKDDENKKILRTNDLGYLDNEGFLYIKGRKDRYIKLYGLRINLEEIEEIGAKNNVKILCTAEEKKINVYFAKNININILQKSIVSHTNLHPRMLNFIKIKKFNINKNYKYSYNKDKI